MITVGKRLLSAIICTGTVNDLFNLQLFPELFRDGEEASLYEFLTQHVSNHGAVPHIDTVEGKMGDVLVEAPEPISFYMEGVQKRFIHTKLKKAVLEAQDGLKKDNPEAVMKMMNDLMMELYAAKNRAQMFDYRDSADMIHAEYMKKASMSDDTGIGFGWPYLDGMSSGMQPGDFITINGRPAAGKTFAALRIPLHSWRKGLSSPLFASMEMGAVILRQRLAAMDTHKPLTQLMKGMLSTKAYKAMMEKLEQNKQMPHPLHVVDGNLTSTADDIVSFCRQHKPTLCVVDAAYLLRHSNPRLGKWERIGENAELLKTRVAGDLGIPVVASYQLKREAVQKGKKNADHEPGVEDIYGNDAMGQLSTIALGFFEMESIETIKRRKATVMKGRNGEVGEFLINWNFMQMDFDEIVEAPKEEMQFLG